MNVSSRDLQTLFTVGSVGGLSDRKLLERFAADRDEAAFEALLARHGPMVWGVCKRILREPSDAEDALQATFLVLARKANGIAHPELLAGWLYAVAYKTAVRARAMASRRRAREQQVANLPEPEANRGERQDDLLALLDQELSRLPRNYRIPVVLCELEGQTHREAASQLGWPVGTVSSRLSRARAMLAQRLARRGVGLAAGALAGLLAQEAAAAPMPARLIGATAQAASLFAAGGAPGAALAHVAELSREVLKMMLVSRLKLTALVFLALAGAGLVWSGSASLLAGQQRKQETAQPAPAPAAKADAPAQPAWAHLTSDAGFEAWVRLEDGRNLWKYEQSAGVHDPASGTELSYHGASSIVQRPDIVAVHDDGSRNVGFALERAGVKPLEPAELRQRMTPEGRRIEGGNFASDAQVVDLDGHRCLRIDMSRPDSLGRLRLGEQTWYDLDTRRPIRKREILQLADQMKYKREFRTTTITYGDTGPADIYALGVPDGTPIVDESKLDRAAGPAALQEAFDGAARAIGRLPRSVRVVDDGDVGLRLTYWSAPKESLEDWAAFVRDHNDSSRLGTRPPRSFFADHQGADLPRYLSTGPGDELPANRLAAWLPIDQSVNVHLRDGTRAYDLTRFHAAPDKPRDVRVHVHRDDSGSLAPDWVRSIWPYAFDNRRNLKLSTPEPGTPNGWVAIRVEYPEIQNLYYADSAHGYAVSRKVEWSTLNNGRMKFRTDSKAVRWEQLPTGVWYVTEWERLHHLDKLDASGKPEPEQQPDSTSSARVVITPMDPDKFPPGIFDGERFLEAARKEGAKIEVD